MDVEQYHALPLSGGLLNQPAGLMKRIRQVMNVYHSVRLNEQYGNKPGATAKWRSENEEIWNVVSDINKLRETYG